MTHRSGGRSPLSDTQILTGVFSGVVGLLAFSPKHYLYWWRWAFRFLFFSVPVLFAANGAIGLVGYSIGHALHWNPPGPAAVAAAQYAAAGQGLVRMQFRGYDLDRVDGALTFLSLVAGWIVKGLDTFAAPGVAGWVRGRTDSQIRLHVYEILEDQIAPDSHVERPVLELINANMEEWSSQMSTGDHDLGRGAMNGFCIRQMQERHLVMPKD